MTPEREPLGTVLVIVPTYNESMNIASIVGRLRTANPDVHVLVADDNSPDGTGDIADGMAAADDHIHVLHRKGKEGLAAAYVAGFRWGIDHGYGVLVEHDADGSHQPEQLPRLLEALKNADMVKGSRYVKGGSVVNWPKSRELLSRGGNIWSQLMLGSSIKDLTGGYNAHRVSMMKVIIDKLESAGYAFQVNLAWQALQNGFTVVEVPIEFIEREQGASKMSRRIVFEALGLTTKWGINHRIDQVKGLFGKGSKQAVDGSEHGDTAKG
ncbi:MAG: polyprenol monophosphomannose synthase [Propionibacteriaceae bacterium]|nr:polyprenol monophosphomannose synthase [Micropruina sp.]HBX79943.1 dolichol-phosphate mannosyltransferase [Propionibacteriaceae bacterium]HBY22656.1 dolichol-phosphate mannosyltransferase [Propionibacteriaceae bacterium]